MTAKFYTKSEKNYCFVGPIVKTIAAASQEQEILARLYNTEKRFTRNKIFSD